MKKILPIACLMLAFGISLAAEVRPRFDTKEVVRRVRKAQAATDRQRDMTEIRQGISDRVPGRPRSTPAYDWGEFLLDTSITRAPAPGDQDMPAIAFDGTNFLVVWHDEREGSYDIYGARVTADGVVMDPSGIVVSAATSDQLYPAVAFDGTDFLVVWQDERSGESDIYGARMTKDGAVLDPSGIAVSTAAYDQSFPAVSFDGTNFLVVWQDEREDEFGDIYGARVSMAGAVLDPTGIAICRVVYDQMFPAVAFDGANFLVVWEDERNGYGDIYGARVTGAGAVLDTTGIAVSAAADDQGGPGVAFDGSNFLVVWHDLRGGEFYDIYGARVSVAGVVLDPAGIAVSTAPDDQEWPAAAFDGTNFNISWQDWRGGIAGDIYCARMSQAGAVLDPSGIAVSRTQDDQGYPRVAFSGSSFLMVWEDDRDSSYSIYGARVTKEGSVLDSSGIPVSTTTDDQWFPAIGYDGTNYFVVWQDARHGAYDIYGARIAPSGTILDAQPIRLGTNPSSKHDPDLAFDGTNYLVVWEDFRNGRTDIYGTRVTKAGVVLDPSGIAICTAPADQWEPTPVFGHDNFLVVWHDYRNASGPDIYAARVTPAGAVLDPEGIAVCTAAGSQWYTDPGFNGTNFLVPWADRRNGTYDIYCARVSEAGEVLDPAGIVVSAAAYDQQWPAMAFDGTNYLLAWIDTRRASSADIFGARVSGEGVVLDSAGIPICTADGDQWYPSMTFDGTNYLVGWTDGRAGAATDIYGAHVTPGGQPSGDFPLITGDGNQWSGALGSTPGGQTLLAYGSWAGNVNGKSYNTYRIWGKFGPFPGVTEGQESPPGGSRQMATVARGVLYLPKSAGSSTSWLLDATGRTVADLKPGTNDVSSLPAGVYFVGGRGGTPVQKVLLMK